MKYKYSVQHSETGHKGEFYINKDHEKAASMTYTKAGEERIIIDHTEVQDSLRGTGAGKVLVEKAVQWARENNIKVFPLCPFAKSVIESDASLQDVL